MSPLRWTLYLAALLVPSLARAQERPNVIVFLADDQGWGDLSINGNHNLSTPRVDSLAREGARFERFFVQPVCSPTRAEFLTGRHHPRGGVRGVSTGQERLDLDEKTIADAFRAAGYATGAFGKWHNGSQYPYHPLGRGFEEYYGFTSGHWADYFDPPLDQNGTNIQGSGYFADDITSKAIDFLTRASRDGRPFFCYVTFNTPHSPMQVPDLYWDRFKNKDLFQLGDGRPKEDSNHTRAALAMCENIDDNVGRVLDVLRERKIEEKTIVVYFSDNGPNGPRWNGGMKGRKGSTDEGGVRSPLHVRWPGKIAAGSTPKLISGSIDLMPTLLGLTGVPCVSTKAIDGIDLSPWLHDDARMPPDRVLYQHWAGKVSARSQRFRLDAAGTLYDLENDPGQTRGATAEFPEEAKRLEAAVARWKNEVLAASRAPDDRPFPVGHSAMPHAVLPARDGVPHGGVARSASAPNSSFFTHWSKTDDKMTWEVEVAEAGRFEAILHYTCPAADIGSTIELRLGDVSWKGKVEVAHDPPLQGAERDRVPRVGESYMKVFRAMSLGTMKLPKGSGLLTLRASEVTGRHVADVLAVELVKLENGAAGDAVLRAPFGPSEIVITTTERLAGAIDSLTWNGMEFIDSHDHGRQLQSAASFDLATTGPFVAERFNPTEAGSRRDGLGPTSSSRLLKMEVDGPELRTTTRMAYWLAPGEKTAGREALNTTVLSNHLVSKRVRIGHGGLANVIEYDVRFQVPEGERHTYAQFEALTGYMPRAFSRFWTFQPETGELEALDAGPGEQARPIIVATESGSHAMGIFSVDQPSAGFENAGYGRFVFPRENVVKWNCVFRERDKGGIAPGERRYPMYVVVGDLKSVQSSLMQLSSPSRAHSTEK